MVRANLGLSRLIAQIQESHSDKPAEPKVLRDVKWNAESEPPEFDEKAALKGLANLDPAVISMVHNRFYPEVYRYARFRIQTPQLAEDLASGVFLRLIEALHAGKGPRKSLRGWLMGTLSNMVNDHYRKLYKYPEESISEVLPGDDLNPAAGLEQTEEMRVVQAAVSTLTEEQQHVIALRFGSGYSLKDTSRAIGKKVNAVKQLQYRALTSLRKSLLESKRDNETN